MTFDMNELEGRIAYAIYNECSERYYDLNEFCSAYGFTEQDFINFLQHGIDAMTALRLMDKYYSEHQPEYKTVEIK
jgi:hypothetical protein